MDPSATSKLTPRGGGSPDYSVPGDEDWQGTYDLKPRGDEEGTEGGAYRNHNDGDEDVRRLAPQALRRAKPYLRSRSRRLRVELHLRRTALISAARWLLSGSAWCWRALQN